MYFFVFEATAPSNEGAEAVDGFAFVWVNSAKYPQAERAALEFAAEGGLTVRGIQTSHKPTPEQLATMSLEDLAARAQGLLHGRWGYFAARVGDESENRPRMELRPLKNP